MLHAKTVHADFFVFNALKPNWKSAKDSFPLLKIG